MDEVRKISAIIPVSAEVLADMLGPYRELTLEERAAADRWMAVERVYHVELAEALASAPDPLSWVAAAHGPAPDHYSGRPICEGCDFDGYEAEPPEWPCSTASLIGELLGVERPDGH